ncbi:MAG: GDSL-type esterase/lipase family protein [Eubacteriales bacterium]|nr:GDSL-type esterase/lipase family protein [Eubacteriales bacterium]
MESYNSNNDRPKISLNRKKRMWNRYRNYVIGLIILVVAVIIFAVVLKSCSSKNGGKDDNKSTTAPVQQESTQDVTQESKDSSQEATQQTTQAASGRSLTVSGTAQNEDYTSSSAYSKAVFIGDFVVSGISQFGYLPDSQVISSNSMTSDKLTGYLDNIVSQSPDSVYIMVGINDLNYGSRSVEDIYKYEKEFIEAVKSALPSANVYVLSVLPVSQKFESSSKVKQANIDSLNGMFSENASTLGITYIDVAFVFKDGSGYFGSSYTDSGYNLKSGYYAFMLNGIAGVK